MKTNFFNRDLHAESILGEFLDCYLYPNIHAQSVERIDDKGLQYEGVDIEVIINNQNYFIDEKGYLSRPTIQNTFVLELSYLNCKGERKEGWLFNPNKITTHYLLCWADRDDVDLDDLTIDNLHLVEAILVNRAKLHTYLWNRYQLNRITANQKVNELLAIPISDPIYLPNSFSKYKLSHNMFEQPLNIVMPKDEYLQSGSVEAWFKIDRAGCRRLELQN